MNFNEFLNNFSAEMLNMVTVAVLAYLQTAHKRFWCHCITINSQCMQAKPGFVTNVLW